MYSRSRNENGSSNTRCLYCFLAVASDVETAIELITYDFFRTFDWGR
jgi:hypothetical protein